MRGGECIEVVVQVNVGRLKGGQSESEAQVKTKKLWVINDGKSVSNICERIIEGDTSKVELEVHATRNQRC